MIRRLLDHLRRGDDGIGRRGERLAARMLRRKGYRIVERNLSIGKDEADLVALSPDRRSVVIVEVKTRRDDRALPEEHINQAKRHHLSRLAAHLIRQRRFANKALRFDVVAIVWRPDQPPVIRHHEGAFESDI